MIDTYIPESSTVVSTNKTFQGRIVQKHDIKANWDKATNFIPLKGEIIIYDDLNKIKIGDGTTTVVNLPYSTTTNYSDLSNKPAIGNGTLTIQRNGSKIGTFTANATTDSTIDIDVPDKKNYEFYTIITKTDDGTLTADHEFSEITDAVRENLDVFCILEKTYFKSPRFFAPSDAASYLTFSAIDNKNNLLKTLYIDESETITYKETNLNCLPLTGGTMTGDIQMSNKSKVTGVSALNFSDTMDEKSDTIYTYLINNDGELAAQGIAPNGDFTLVFDTIVPKNASDAVEHLKEYGSENSTPLVNLRNIAEPAEAYDVANKDYVDTTAKKYLPLKGGTISGSINRDFIKMLDYFTIIPSNNNKRNPTGPSIISGFNGQDTTSGFHTNCDGGSVVTFSNGSIPLAIQTGTLSGVGTTFIDSQIDMNDNFIHNLATPTADTDATNKKYVDDQIAASTVIITWSDDGT